VLRRVHVSAIRPGNNPLPDSQAHHLRVVLRLAEGDTVELFDNAGSTATATITKIDSSSVILQVAQIDQKKSDQTLTTMAVAVPKGDRADWMVEKLSELGIATFVPLITERSVVNPQGTNKIDRWRRIAVESAKQSRRPGVMQIAPPLALQAARAAAPPSWYCSTTPDAIPILTTTAPTPTLWIFVGPEGGWSPQELTQFQQANATPIALTPTILRVETAAITVAAILACRNGNAERKMQNAE
jgi:16S rRNA (uracil1498-N3)-methyltransferase